MLTATLAKQLSTKVDKTINAFLKKNRKTILTAQGISISASRTTGVRRGRRGKAKLSAVA